MKIKDEKTGEEIEVFTAAETQERVKAAEAEAAQKAVDEYKTANPDKADEINRLKTDLEKAQKELEDAEKGGDKDGQVSRLRKERDEANAKLNEFATTITKRLDDITNASVKEIKEDLLNKLSGGNAETKKKIELEFDKYNSSDNSKQGIADRMAVAAQIVTGSKPKPGFMDNISGGGDRGSGGGNGGGNGQKSEPTPNQLAIGKVLGITDKDRENYENFKKQRGQ